MNAKINKYALVLINSASDSLQQAGRLLTSFRVYLIIIFCFSYRTQLLKGEKIEKKLAFQVKM